MLLEFEVSGFASIKEKISLNFQAKHGQKINGTRYEDNYFQTKPKVAKSVVLFGSNATGKTNVLNAILMLLKSIVVFDFKEIVQNINHSSDEVYFLVKMQYRNSTIYQYELKINREKILFEKLAKNDVSVYEFKNDKLKFDSHREFESIFSIESKNTILNKLEDNNITELIDFQAECVDFSYADNINFYDLYDKNTKDIISFGEYIRQIFEDSKEQVLEILSLLDEGISDFIFIDNTEKRYALVLKRGDIKFPIEKESSGIKKVIEIMSDILSSLKYGRVVLIDELDSSISTNTLIRFINTVVNSQDNTRAQFIFTSHNPLLFDTDLFAPQQIYIVGKEDCCTNIKCLHDFELRNDKRKAYLNYLRGDYE